MILFPYFELAAALFILLFAFHIHLRHHDNRVARFFVRFALVAFFACIFTYSYRIAFTLDLAQTLNRISATLFAFAFPVYTHFALIFAKKGTFLKKKSTLAILYIPPAILGCLFLFTNLMYSRYDIYPYGIASQPAPLYWLFILETSFYTIWGIFLFLRYAKTAHQKIVRSQALLIGFGSLVPVTIGLFADEILPLIFNLRLTPPTVVFDFAIMILFIYLAMRWYSLFAISPGLAARQIIETMPDSLLVTDLEGRILLLNDEAHKFFHCDKEEIIGKKISTLFKEKDKYHKLYNEVVNKNLEIERFEAKLCDPHGECIPSLINANELRDELGGLLGIIFIVRDIRG
ncbi:MAG: PAS domain-containing protein [Candidatus Saganbacteria bacterium]|nr:PAS domain-containing protein [Candidatus Saganbacteria bacterium]